MTWIVKPINFNSNGNVDKKEEARRFVEDKNFEILKDTIQGSVYYAAVKDLRTEKIFAQVVLIHKSTGFKGDLEIKVLSEFDGPLEKNCPKGILNLLSPTDNYYANEWRKECLENIARKASKRKKK